MKHKLVLVFPDDISTPSELPISKTLIFNNELDAQNYLIDVLKCEYVNFKIDLGRNMFNYKYNEIHSTGSAYWAIDKSN